MSQNFVDGIRLLNRYIPFVEINSVMGVEVYLSCRNYAVRTPMCQGCDVEFHKDDRKELIEKGFTVVDNKCCISYNFNKK